MEELKTITEATLVNKDLKGYTKKIKTCGENIRKNYIKISFLLNQIDITECYLEDGFSSVQEYASTVLGIQKTTTYNLLNIAKDYINEKGDRTVLTTEGNDYGVSQLQALLPLGVDEAKSLHDAGVISPEMSVRQIKSIVSDNKDVETESEGDAEGETLEESEEIITILGSIDFLEDGTIATHGELPEKFIIQIEKYFKMCHMDGELNI